MPCARCLGTELMNTPHYTHFDPAALLADLFDSVEIVQTVLSTFADWHGSAQNELRAAAEAGDAQRLARITHTLRGTLSQVHATQAVILAQALEQRCKSADASFQPGLIDIAPLKQEIQAVADEISAYLSQL